MPSKEDASLAFDKIIQAGRQKKQHERLAQEMLGKRRSSTPNNASRSNLGASLSNRAGVSKRPALLSRSTSSQARLASSATSRRLNTTDNQNPPRQNNRAQPQREQQPKAGARSGNRASNLNGAGLNIKGAAGGPYIVVASNFAPGTSASDIESVMVQVSEDLTYCNLIESTENGVVAEMGFSDRAGADQVIKTFNNKKADGRYLYLSMKESKSNSVRNQPQQQQAEPQHIEEVQMESVMDVDENAQAREVEDKIREERRGGGDRAHQDVFPSGPRRARVPYVPKPAPYYHGEGGSFQGNQRNGQGYQDGGRDYGNGDGYGGRGGRGYDDRRGYGHGRGALSLQQISTRRLADSACWKEIHRVTELAHCTTTAAIHIALCLAISPKRLWNAELQHQSMVALNLAYLVDGSPWQAA